MSLQIQRALLAWNRKVVGVQALAAAALHANAIFNICKNQLQIKDIIDP